MLHVITVLGGEGHCTQMAQSHGVRMAQLFQAKLRVVTVWESADTEELTADGRSLESRADEEVSRVLRQAGDIRISAESSLRGEGLLNGLLAEARESDLLVIGLPERASEDEPLFKVILHEETSLLHKAECLVLIVREAPHPIQKILVDYPGGLAGKAALRAAGEVAMRASASVTIHSVSGEPLVSEMLAASAERYLMGFGLSAVQGIVRQGDPSNQGEMLRAVNSMGADMLIVGGERHSLMDVLWGKATLDPEDAAMAMNIPTLIAR